MSGFRRRIPLSRQLGLAERRLRASLEGLPKGAVIKGTETGDVTDPCANAAGADAGKSYCSADGSSDLLIHQYQDIQVSDVDGLSPGGSVAWGWDGIIRPTGPEVGSPPGLFALATSFTGSDARAYKITRGANLTAFQGTNDCTVEFWTASASSYVFSCRCRVSGNTANANFNVRISSGNLLIEYGTQSFSTTLSGGANGWYHIAVVFDFGLQQLRVIVNGTLQTTHNIVNGLQFPSPGSDIQIGADGQGTKQVTSPNLSATEFRIWDYLRTAADVSADYQQTLTGSETGLQLYVPCSEGSGIGAQDFGPFGYDVEWTVDSQNTQGRCWSEGRFGGGPEDNSIAEQFNSPADLAGLTEATIMVWWSTSGDPANKKALHLSGGGEIWLGSDSSGFPTVKVYDAGAATDRTVADTEPLIASGRVQYVPLVLAYRDGGSMDVYRGSRFLGSLSLVSIDKAATQMVFCETGVRGVNEARIYNRKMSQTEIEERFRTAAVSSDPDLYRWFRFSEGSGDTSVEEIAGDDATVTSSPGTWKAFTGLDATLAAGALRAPVELEFLDAGEGLLGSYQPSGPGLEAWSRDGASAVLPASTAILRFSAWRRGSRQGSACARRLQVNAGTTPCAYKAPASILSTDVVYSAVDAGSASVNSDLDLSAGEVQLLTLDQSGALTLSGAEAGRRYYLVLTQDSTGSRTVTWPASVLWAGGAAPTLSAAAGAVDVIELLYDGTSFYGTAWGLNFS